jgi:hypothetical protein
MHTTKISAVLAALIVSLAASPAMAAAGGNGNGNNGNGNGNGGSTGNSGSGSGNSGNSGSNGSGSNSGGSGSGGNSNAGGNSGGSTPVLTASCSGGDISVSGASCLGFFSGNLNGNNHTYSSVSTDLSPWGVHLNGAVASSNMLSGLGNGSNVINFSQQLYGDTVIGIHYGVVTGANGATSNDVTAFYRFDAGNGTGIDTLTTSFGSLSNATLYMTGVGTIAPAVPEPATYGMLLAGLALMGAVVRRRKQK